MKMKNTQNLWDIAKVVLRGKHIGVNVSTRKESPQTKNLNLYLKKLGKKMLSEIHQSQKTKSVSFHLYQYSEE